MPRTLPRMIRACDSASAVRVSIDVTRECPWDCGDGDGVVGTIDFLALLSEWAMVGSACDLDSDGVDTVDFLALLSAWGPC